MAKFVFRFKSYLSVKEKVEDQKKIAYGKALKQLEEEKRKKREMINERENAINSFKEKLQKRISAADTQMHNNFLAYIKEAISKQEKVIKAAENEAEKKRLELVEAMKERKTLEKLKERDYEEYVIESKKEEEKITDGVVSYKYSNRGI
ncbi:MAG: flagellar export protein FliJ [Clostridiales bacterium]|jgi:flagellar FliJ protein|nr:flagellar export protein FliJ [Clostridiales bacterium]